MRRRNFLKAILLARAAPWVRAQTGTAPRPNILIVLGSELPAWVLGCYGNQDFQTPNIDRLAVQGVRFEQSSVCTPAGSPSRATLFTGRTPMQHGLQDDLIGHTEEQAAARTAATPRGLDTEIFLSDILAGNGYTCGYFGIWGLGGEAHPQHGFQQWYVNDRAALRYQDPAMHSNLAGGEAQKLEEKGYLTDLIHARALAFMEAARQQQRPWFCVVSHLNPHPPLDGHPQRYYDLYRESNFKSARAEPAKSNATEGQELLSDPAANLRKVAASVSALDDRVGDLVGYLDEKKLSYSTILAFTSDCGALFGRHGYWGSGSGSRPINMYEEAVCVPLIARWLGRIPPGRTRKELVSTYDFVPSMLEILGKPQPKGRNLCGRSYWPLATTRALGRWDNRTFGRYRDTAMIREEQYKLVLRNAEKNQWRGPNELWDLAADPAEQANRFEDRALGRERQRMTRDLNAWVKKYGQ